ncbi:metallophosphoesterase [Perlabentimonas gracilis]|uniref:metallophosphoesterase n=1 Tax=Perlabentimonas gracilis TaxID=2715279 RepID=UPI00140BAB43|nr:metallophosphoesterase [Perlabentimonas gracilis]NHB69641.1 metallophosphoesterase [Perlabentimonas gracilis]
MKRNIAMLIFFSIVLIVTIGVNYYIYRRTNPIFAFAGGYELALRLLFWAIALSYPIGRFLERVVPSGAAELVAKVGSFWLAAMLYLTLMFLLFDLLKLMHSWTGFPSFLSAKDSISFLRKISVGIYATTAIIIFAGYLNAIYPKVSSVTIKTDKSLNGNAMLKIAAASDIHLGTIISNGRLERFVHMMNEQKPDIILLAGDIFDEDLGPVIKNNMGDQLKQLSAPLGVYAITGNHEYIGGVDAAIKYLEDHGITVIRDSVVTPQGKLNVVGRDDRQAKMMGGNMRKPIEHMVVNIDNNLFTIMLDHQPYNLNEAVENGIDLQISGHTHHGQLFPLNLITKAMFEVSRGYKQIENSHFYVSTGFGTWGPPVRVGNKPEIVVFEVSTGK